MAHVATPTQALPLSAGFVQARGTPVFSGVALIENPWGVSEDLRFTGDTTGQITSVVVSKASGSEVPAVGAKVWVLRAIDGLVVWAGFSGAGGTYTATGMELGVAYVVVAQDLATGLSAVAAGPTFPAAPTPEPPVAP